MPPKWYSSNSGRCPKSCYRRSPLERLWSTSTTGGYGDVASNNPYFNQIAKHAYSVFYDFNHSKAETRYYVNRVLEQWISEYKIDGFRWDLTKGFTQNCTPSDEACTGAYQQDRVDVLKLYSDYQWSYDPTSYVIFEHLGTDAEEQQWANYRVNEGKGVMMWDNLTGPLVKTPWVTILIATSTESILKIMDSQKEEMSLMEKVMTKSV
jgi:hypothetical protein